VTLVDREEQCVKFYFEKSILCMTQKQASFIGKLLLSLSASKCFEGTATLEHPDLTPNPNPPKFQYFSEDKSLRHSAAFLSSFRISYNFVSHFQAEPE
jgi:hypothetical protein